MALIEYDPARVQAANQIRELRAEALARLAQVDLVMQRIRKIQEQMVGNPAFTDDDLKEVDAVVEEIHGAVGDQGSKQPPALVIQAAVVDEPVKG